jgi:hypothetical protein
MVWTKLGTNKTNLEDGTRILIDRSVGIGRFNSLDAGNGTIRIINFRRNSPYDDFDTLAFFFYPVKYFLTIINCVFNCADEFIGEHCVAHVILIAHDPDKDVGFRLR